MSRGVTPFRVAFDEADLADLKDRLARTRWPEAETVDDWSQGVPLAYLKELAEHWRTGYDWRATEARLNELPQFRTEIDGLGVHFVHARSPHPNALPLLVSHGWPGSVVEFLDLVRPLTHPENPADAFHVVCPSLPGFAFSDKPATTGWTVERTAAAWAELMARLGYDRYAAHGVDWGSFLTGVLGETDGAHLVGIHLAMPFARPPQEQVPLDERDVAGLAALKEFQQNEGGYSVLQATRPQTLGYGLTDSPVAQLAWMAEKYWAWTDHDGDLEKVIPRERLLDCVTLAWLCGTGASSARIYWESHNKMALAPVSVPAALAVFPKDARMPRAWCEARFTDLRRWTDHASGGHFPALEQPGLLVDELRSFFRALR
ncbi:MULTISPECIES: epoxide hydrolase family protein [unclassified Streptomyces]|uniref:epoxide hydrolase family protein n=1 Tax=unclassified Streptomyces TaxID=2593676 RepID=UPI0022541B64|nr:MULTISPECIES: epoxide hydrolase family protein [unclassified Streptomyces]MCX5062371.1 epoxide hydrolase [Streptomyces sp. NBC_00452]MCX5292021.1 epoxide hydrolase [Streptomyces sp. NBC_00183]